MEVKKNNFMLSWYLVGLIVKELFLLPSRCGGREGRVVGGKEVKKMLADWNKPLLAFIILVAIFLASMQKSGRKDQNLKRITPCTTPRRMTCIGCRQVEA